MQLDELKKTMSTLEQVLAKTNADIKIDVAASETAQSKILRKFKQAAIVLIIVAGIMIAATIANLNVESFPNSMKIYLTAILVIASIWFGWMYSRVKRINVTSLAPAILFAKTAKLKLSLIVGEVCLIVALAVFFALCLPYTWEFNRLGFWLVIIALPIAVGYDIFRLWPGYIKLFRELNSIAE